MVGVGNLLEFQEDEEMELSLSVFSLRAPNSAFGRLRRSPERQGTRGSRKREFTI